MITLLMLILLVSSAIHVVLTSIIWTTYIMKYHLIRDSVYQETKTSVFHSYCKDVSQFLLLHFHLTHLYLILRKHKMYLTLELFILGPVLTAGSWHVDRVLPLSISMQPVCDLSGRPPISDFRPYPYHNREDWNHLKMIVCVFDYVYVVNFTLSS